MAQKTSRKRVVQAISSVVLFLNLKILVHGVCFIKQNHINFPLVVEINVVNAGNYVAVNVDILIYILKVVKNANILVDCIVVVI